VKHIETTLAEYREVWTQQKRENEVWRELAVHFDIARVNHDAARLAVARELLDEVEKDVMPMIDKLKGKNNAASQFVALGWKGKAEMLLGRAARLLGVEFPRAD